MIRFSIKSHGNQLSSQQTPQQYTRLLPTYKRINLFYLPFHTHDEDHFDHPQILKLASSTHTEMILNRDKKTQCKLSKNSQKKLLLRQNVQSHINSRFTPATNLKIGTFVSIVQHRNILLPYYTKEHALCELTQLYSFTGLKAVPDPTEN